MLALIFGHGQIDNRLSTYGYGVVFVMVITESLGIRLPGETTLIAAALFAGSTHNLSIWLVFAVAAAGVEAAAGDQLPSRR